jgi:hypothetical protein
MLAGGGDHMVDHGSPCHLEPWLGNATQPAGGTSGHDDGSMRHAPILASGEHRQ